MTRINVVPVEELSDQHLIAEYHELPRVLKQELDLSDAPNYYCLGVGHMKWARKHWRYTLYRYYDLCCEMIYRGFNTKYHWRDLFEEYCISIPISIEGWYTVRKKDRLLNRKRLIEQYRMKPNWYRWTNREKPAYMEA